MSITQCRVIESGICYITQPFHYTGQYGYTYNHFGIDLVDWNGSYTCLNWIVAHSDGKVVALRNDCVGKEANSYGNYVLLQHANGMYTMYAHLYYGTVQVYVGQTVKKGQRLGYMDNSGTSDGGHLHWEVRQSNGTQIDPQPYLNAPLPYSDGWVTWINDGWYYVVDGAVDYKFTGVAQNENGWWYCKNGKVDFNYTGLGQNKNGWWYCKGGKVDFDYNGVVKNENGYWKVENGKVNFNFNGLYNTQNSDWYYFKGGKIDFSYSGVVNNGFGWWAVVNGKVDFKYNGLLNNENGWWMMQNGKVDFDYNGLCINKNGIWVLEKGKVNFGYNGDYSFSGSIYKIKNGKVED